MVVRSPFFKILLLITIISALLYVNFLHNSFHFDDQHYIVGNPYIRDIFNIPSFFKSTQYSSFEKTFTSHYRPLLVTSYAINYAIGGLNPSGYHVVNLLFHIGSAFMVFLILEALLGSRFIPIAAALLFAVHPFNSEVVNYITARSSVMCSFFYLLSFYCWVRFNPPLSPFKKGGLRGIYYIASILAFILAMLTKEIAITLPVMLFLYDLYFMQTRKLKSAIYNLRYYFPYIFLIIIPYLAYRVLTFGRIAGGGTRDFYTNLLIQPRVLLRYLKLFFFPYGLTIEHDIAMTSTIYDSTVILSIISLLFILIVAYLFFKKGGEWRVLSFFILWFFITILPTTLIPLNAVLQENRGYLPGIVFFSLAGICLGKLRQRVSIPLLLVLITLFSVLTFQRNFVWSDDYTLWSDAVKKAPSSARAHDNLGLAYIGRGEYDHAIDEFRKTLALHPLYYLAYYNAGVVYQLQNRLDMALSAYEACIKINPQYFRSYYNLGIVYKKMGNLDKSIEAYEKAISLDSRHSFVYNNLGVALTDKGESDKAESVFKRAIDIDPWYEKAYYNLGNLYYREKRYNLAADAYRAALKIAPEYKEAREMLNTALMRLSQNE